MRGVSIAGAWIVVAGCNAARVGGPPATPAAPRTVVVVPAPSSAAPLPAASSAITAASPTLPEYVTAAPYRTLFDRGHVWRFRERYEQALGGEGGKIRREVFAGRSSCTVVHVRVEETSVRAAIECDGGTDVGVPNPLAGLWVARPDGLHRLSPDEPTAALTEDTLVLPRPLVETTRKTQDVSEPSFTTETKVESKKGAWCWSLDSNAGDAGWQSLCFEAGRGVISGKHGWSGGVLQDVTFDLDPG